MFLLIRIQQIALRLFMFIFKFHYVSINSKETSCKGRYGSAFKFHYVSINSSACFSNCSGQYSFKFHYVSINSRLPLIPSFISPFFKFHYVSINSRPKTNCLFTPRNTFILSTSSKYIISFSLFIICFSNTSYFSHFLLLSIPYVFYTITGRQKSLYFYHIKFFISLTLPIMNPINQICNPNIQIHI